MLREYDSHQHWYNKKWKIHNLVATVLLQEWKDERTKIVEVVGPGTDKFGILKVCHAAVNVAKF